MKMFIKDIYRMVDFLKKNREDFLNSHKYITGLEYDLTKDIFNQDIVNNVVKLYRDVESSNMVFLQENLQIIKNFISKLDNKKRTKVEFLLDI